MLRDDEREELKRAVRKIVARPLTGEVIIKLNLGGTIVWTRVSTGRYEGTLTGAFTLDKTDIMTPTEYAGTNSANFIMGKANESVNTSTVRTMNLDATFPSQELADGLLNKTRVEIKIYP